MFGTARPPSAQELQELIELTQRDPGSPAFVDLCEAYIALGRLQEAVDVGLRGLQANPYSVDGRMMMSRALAQMHQWKQAQVELLKVVKSDRNHAAGFTLLGEVLMRRSDYDRALPVLQHAQNLDPGNPQVLELSRRARNRIPLDPPAPVPTPRSPAPALAAPPGAGPLGASARPLFDDDDEPTRVAQPLMAGSEPAIKPPPPSAPPPPRAAPPPPARKPAMPPPGGSVLPAVPKPLPVSPPPPAPAAAPKLAGPALAAPRPSPAPPPPGPSPAARPSGGVRPRPRVLGEKPKGAAQASLRQSAAVGENYLNNLLTAGLLDVPNVNAPEAEFELAPGKRWGRSTKRAFIVLFVIFFMMLGGGGYWYYYAEKQRAADVAAHLAKARQLLQSGSYEDLRNAIVESQEALKRDKKNTSAMAVYAKASSLLALLYGIPAEGVEIALASAQRQIKEGKSGWQDLVIARAALNLAVLREQEQPKVMLDDTRKTLSGWLDKNPDDLWARWLNGMALQAAGDYPTALQSFEMAAKGENSPVVATIAAADLHLDKGDPDAARKLYEAALERAPKHPLALLGMVLLKTETGADPSEIAGEINVHFDKKKMDYGERVNAYATLALAMSKYLNQEYKVFSKELDKAKGVLEPRYLARVAYGRLLEGKLTEAVDLRASIIWFGDKSPEPPPALVILIDAEMQILLGSPDEALKMLKGLKGLRAMRLRGRALYDQGNVKEALEELDAALEIAPDDVEALMWRDAAKLVAARGRKAQKEPDSALKKLALNSASLAVPYVHGDALLRIRRTKDASNKLKASLKDVSDEYPNPLAYRAHVALAQIEYEASRDKAALEHLDKALEQVPGYLPALALKGRVHFRMGDMMEALKALKVVLDEPEAATADLELMFAEALVSFPKVSKDARELARGAVRRAKEKEANPEELARVAELVDPLMLEELGLPPPKKKR